MHLTLFRLQSLNVRHDTDETQCIIPFIEEAMHLGLPTDVEALLIIETDGTDEGTVAREIEAAGRICEANGARSVKVARDDAERSDLWNSRRSLSPSLARMRRPQSSKNTTC